MRARVRLLGGFAVEVDDRPVADGAWETRRSRQLVEFLALTPRRRATADEVMDALWPDLDPDAARANLHKAASLARRALSSKDALVSRSGTVALWPDTDVEVDVAFFEAGAGGALGEPSPERCAEAASRYGGELLPDERYEEWTLGARERLRRLYLDVLRAGGQWSALVDADPTDEAAHRGLMRQLVGEGRLHAAIRQFQRVRTILGRELGVAPANETVALYREIVGTAASGSVRPGLVGREVELVRARAAVRRAREGRPAALLVTGPAGIGKTRLGEELADQAAADGWFVLRAAAREPTSSVPYAALAEAIRAALVQGPELATSLSDEDRQLLACLDGTAAAPPPALVHRQSVLHLVMRLVAGSGAPGGVLFLDDVQHADDATVELAHIMASAPFPRGLLVVATYRDVPPVSVLALRDTLTADGVGVEITLGPLRRSEVDGIVTDARESAPPPGDLDLIWELSGGNAFLALEVATSGGSLAGGVHSAVAARMDRLPAAAQDALRAVALVADEFTADEFAALAGVHADQALEHLEAATAGGVVARHDARYRFRHDLVREELCRGAAAADLTAAHAAAAERLAGLGAAPGRVAHHLLAAGRPDDALAWLRRAVDDAFAVGAHADAITLADRALSIAPRDPELLARRAGALDATGDPGAPAAYAVAMAVARPAMRAALAVRRARSLVVSGDVPGALEALAGVDDVEPAARVQLLVARGLAWWCTGRLDEAEEAGREARELALSSADLRDFVDATMLTAMVAHERGAWPQRASLDLLDAGLRPDLAAVVMDAHLCVAESYLYGGAPYAEVMSFATDLRDQAAGSGAARAEAFATTLLGEVHLLGGDTVEAARHLRTAVELHRRVGVLCGEALTLQRLAEVHLADGEAGEARKTLDEAFVAARGSPVAARHLLDRIHGTAIRAAPDAGAAVAAVHEAERAVRGPLETCPPCSVNLAIPAAMASAAGGDLDRAGRHLSHAEHVVAAFYPRGGWGAALDEARAAVARASGDVATASGLLQKAAEGFERWGQRLDAVRCRRSSADLVTAGKV